MGRSISGFRGGKGDGNEQPSCCGTQTSGPLQTLRVRQRDRRPHTGTLIRIRKTFIRPTTGKSTGDKGEMKQVD